MQNQTKKTIARPFLKWAGGKGQLLNKFNDLYPHELVSGKVSTYIEPFVGGGAVLFDVLQKFDIKQAVIIDTNRELINCYKCIKENVSRLINMLEILQSEYIAMCNESRSNFFLHIRSRYNKVLLNEQCDYDKATDFIFLNKTCFNGLFRVNSKGEFNVPFGKYKNPNICDSSNLFAISKLLQKVEILQGDYIKCRGYIADNTFIYFDPPYRPITQTQSFVGYSKNGFNDDDQKKLALLVKEIASKNCKILLSNSDPKNTNPNDNFFDYLYKDFYINRITAKRMINCQADRRGSITEIIVANYRRGVV